MACEFFKHTGNVNTGFLCWCNSQGIKKAMIENVYPKDGDTAVYNKNFGVSLTVNPSTRLTQFISEAKAKELCKVCIGKEYKKCPYYKKLYQLSHISNVL